MQFLAPMMQSGEIKLIDAICMGKPRNAAEGAWVFGGGIEIPCIYQIYGWKKKKQTIRTASRITAL